MLTEVLWKVKRVVNYRDKKESFKPLCYPCELFSKDARFSDQQEFRIALDSRSPKVKKMLNGGQEIFIGSLEDCAVLSPFYYEGVRFVIDFKNQNAGLHPWEKMSGKHLHELRIDPLLNLLEAYYHHGTCHQYFLHNSLYCHYERKGTNKNLINKKIL